MEGEKMKKIIFSFVCILIITLICGVINVYAESDMNTIVGLMKETSQLANDVNKDSGIVGTINDIIGLLQIVGTGISVIVTTMLGIKYMIASPSEKADVKKQIMPILTGCVLLFGAVNLMGLVATFTQVLGS